MGMKWILFRIDKLYRDGTLSYEQYEKLDMAIQKKTIDRIVSHVYSDNEEIVIKKISLRNGCNEAKTKKDFIFSEWP